jgi:hypothetical protein
LRAAGDRRPEFLMNPSAGQGHMIVSLASPRIGVMPGSYERDPHACLNNLKDLNLSLG